MPQDDDTFSFARRKLWSTGSRSASDALILRAYGQNLVANRKTLCFRALAAVLSGGSKAAESDASARSRKATPQESITNMLVNNFLTEMRKQTNILSSMHTILVISLIAVPICLLCLVSFLVSAANLVDKA